MRSARIRSTLNLLRIKRRDALGGPPSQWSSQLTDELTWAAPLLTA